MENFLNIGTVVAICAICYLIGMGVKVSPLNDKYIPIIVGVCGGLLGILGLYVIPAFPADNILDAIAIGITSGLSATGANQIGKQLSEN